ncbi:hypothetical protein WJX73_010469 [Symbiochloris irregularis]|uniref:Amino acid transporter n=1 Tax=Symbiochloris irregularis TaxID=706552 RepID=A0AAW1P087_9CHLO
MTDSTQDKRLSRLGLKQEFRRSFSFEASFSLSFVVMSPLAGISIGLTYAWIVGGPGAAMWGWVVVSFFTLVVGLAMAEIVSGLPSSGGPYFWASLLAGRHSGLLSWITGWCNLFGQIAITAGSAFGAMTNLVAMVQLLTGITVSEVYQLLIQLGFLLIGGAVSSCSPKRIARVFAYGAFVNFAGIIFVVLLLPTVAPWHKSSKFVFATFFTKDQSQWNVPNNAYLWVQATVIASNTLAGFDCCSHISEETMGADSSAPLAIVWSIAACALVGYVLLLGMLFCVQDSDRLLDPDAPAHGFAAGQLVWDVFDARFESGAWSTICLALFVLAGCLGVIASVTSNSRMIFAFARSKAVPFSHFFHGHW